MSKPSKAGLLRRYPALAFVVAAGALALLLPTALNVPQSGPTTLAEFAPVPGSGQGTSDVSELGQAGSGGLGFGSGTGTGGRLPEQSTVGKPSQKKAQLKRCVGDPSRQTEDLLSPPCVAFFDGDNGGVTAKGVTREEVTVVVELERVGQGGATGDDPNLGKILDCAELPKSNDAPQDLFCKAYMKYFNDRYQTYGRTVHLWSNHAVPIADVDQRKKPFALVEQSPSSKGREFKIMGMGYLGQPRLQYQGSAPYMVTFKADLEDQTRLGAGYVCLKLKGRRAKYAGDPLLQSQIRKFAVWYEQDQEKDRFLGELKAMCGLEIPSDYQIKGYQPNSPAATAAARLSAENVTTVFFLYGTSSIYIITGYASAQKWFPEWIVAGKNNLRDVDTNFYARTAVQSQWVNAFGLTFDYRRDAVRDQAWWRAFKDGCSTCPEPSTPPSFGAWAYDQLNMLFYGIQAAGPRLSAEQMDKGLHAIPPNGSPSPYKPSAYFSPGNYSFLKDAMGIWWDPSGAPPGTSGGGCYKLPHDGGRFRASEWVAGDDDAKRPGPCQGDTF